MTMKGEVFPEEEVVSPLSETSSEFRNFYQRERNRITFPIKWIKDGTLPTGIDYRVTRGASGERLVCLRRIPPHRGDAIKIAHELAHFILDLDGFPVTGAQSKLENVSSAMNSMVHDPLVCRMLLPYGFDLASDRKREITESKRQLSRVSRSPSDPIGRLHWSLNYVGDILETEAVGESAQSLNERFCEWFNLRYPDIVIENQGLLEMVQAIGYETPQTMLTLFESVLAKYNLAKYMRILTFAQPKSQHGPH